jgi:hypothetical protein
VEVSGGAQPHVKVSSNQARNHIRPRKRAAFQRFVTAHLL